MSVRYLVMDDGIELACVPVLDTAMSVARRRIRQFPSRVPIMTIRRVTADRWDGPAILAMTPRMSEEDRPVGWSADGININEISDLTPEELDRVSCVVDLWRSRRYLRWAAHSPSTAVRRSSRGSRRAAPG